MAFFRVAAVFSALMVLGGLAHADSPKIRYPVFIDYFYLEGASIEGAITFSGNITGFSMTSGSLMITPKSLDSFYSHGQARVLVKHKKSSCQVSIDDGSYQQADITVSTCTGHLVYVKTRHIKDTHDYTLEFND